MKSYIELGGVAKGYFTRNRIFPLEESGKAVLAFRKECRNTDVYYCTYIFDQEDRGEGTKYFSPLYFDIDGDISSDEEFEKIRISTLSLVTYLVMELGIKGEEIKIYFSGGKGFHVFIDPNVIGIQPSSYLHMAYKEIATHISQRTEYGDLIDTKIYDCKRLIRLPNSINAKTGLYKVPIPLQDIRSIDRTGILDLARAPRAEYAASVQRNEEAASKVTKLLRGIHEEQKNRAEAARRNIIPSEERKLSPCIRELLCTPVQQGNRNNTLVLIASSLVQNGYVNEKAINALCVWNDINEPPLPEKEIIQAYRSAEKMATEGRGYGCSSILAHGCFDPAEVCAGCRIHECIERKQAIEYY